MIDYEIEFYKLLEMTRQFVTQEKSLAELQALKNTVNSYVYCGDCDHSKGDVVREKPRCSLTGSIIYDSHRILNNCPLRRYLEREEELEQEIEKIGAEYSKPNWDGYNALPVKKETVILATKFLKLLYNKGTAVPEIGAEPDGCLTFEWCHSNNFVLSVSMGRDNFLDYAAIIDTKKFHGTETLADSIPDVILSSIQQVARFSSKISAIWTKRK